MKRFLILFCLCAGLVRGEDLPSGRVFANLSDPSIRTDYNFGPGTVKFDRIEGSTVVFKVQVPVSGSSWHPDVRAYLYSPYGVFTPSGSANVVAQTGLPSANVTGEVNGSGTISAEFRVDNTSLSGPWNLSFSYCVFYVGSTSVSATVSEVPQKQQFEMDLVADPDKCIVYHFTSDKGSVNQQITVNAIGQPLPVKEHFSCWLLAGETLSYSVAAYGKKDGSGNWIITESLNLITNSTPCYTAPDPVTTPQNGGEKNDSKIAPSMGAGSGGSSGGNTPSGGDSGTSWAANSGEKGKGFITAPLSDGSQSLEGDWVKDAEFKEGIGKLLTGVAAVATAISANSNPAASVDLTPVTDRMDQMMETQKRERKEDHVPGFSMEKFAERGEETLFGEFKSRAQARLDKDSKALDDAVKSGIGEALTVTGDYSPQFTGGSGSWDKVTITGGPTFSATIDMDPHAIAPWLDSFARIIREVLLWALAYGFVYFSMTQLEKVVFMLSMTPVATSNDSIENELPLVGMLKLAAVGLVSTTGVCLVVTAFVLWTNTQLGAITGWTWSGAIGAAGSVMGKAQSAFSQYGGVYWDFFLQLFPLDAFIEFAIAEVLLIVFAIPISIARAAVKQYLNV
jgi:hypothetical protein